MDGENAVGEALADKVVEAVASGELGPEPCADEVVMWAWRSEVTQANGEPYAEATLRSVLSNSDARYAGSPGKKVFVSVAGSGRPKRYRLLRPGEQVPVQAVRPSPREKNGAPETGGAPAVPAPPSAVPVEAAPEEPAASQSRCAQKPSEVFEQVKDVYGDVSAIAQLWSRLRRGRVAACPDKRGSMPPVLSTM